MSAPSDRILWLDFETLTLDPRYPRAVEFAAALTDGDYVVIDTYETVIQPFGGDRINWVRWDPIVTDMHTASGLRALLDAGEGVPSDLDAEEGVVAMLDRHGVTDPIPYAGSGVAAFDKQIIAAHWLDLDRRLLYYPDPDVGVLRRTLRRWGLECEQREIAHRAMADVLESIRQATEFRGVVRDRLKPWGTVTYG